MSEPVDVYADQFGLNVGPYGCILNFLATSTQPPPAGTPPQSARVASVRMSLEHLKVMTYIIRSQIIEYERQAGVRIQLPQEVLNGLRIGREDWTECWREGDR